MIELRDIHYTRIGTRDLDTAEHFATQVMGLEKVERTPDRLYLRSDHRHHTLCYFWGDPSEQIIAFDLTSWQALDAAYAYLQAQGVPCGRGSIEEAADRHVQGFIWFLDPTGNCIELLARPHDSARRYFPARDAGVTGFGHVGLCTTEPVRDQAFWLQHFNAMVSDWIGPCPLMRVNPRHHQMALFPSIRKGIQHINYQVQDFDDVMRSYYFLKEKGIKIVFGPGRHATSGAIFVYFEGPDGMVYEYSNSDRKIIENPASYRPRQFPMDPSSFCVWGAKPDIAEFKE
jgi:2,3-dihydroxy-p-cumate/2,3-dihydroxybenzoate 3,4-dioxygenase